MAVEVNWENFASNNNDPESIQHKFENLCRQLFTNDFLKENTMELVDPLDIKTLIDENEAKRNALLSELDTRLKVSNATTFIEI